MLEQVSRIHFIGIGGIGVSAVARLALAKGFEVSGSDVRQSQLTDAMLALGAEVIIGHTAANVEAVDLVVVSTAIPEHNVEWVAALANGVTVVHRSEVLFELVSDRTCIGVTGTHGKGTTSAMIAWILDGAGAEPGFVIGGLLNNYGINARLGTGEHVVLEVDESDGSHHRINPSLTVCNFLEADHLNYYDDLDHIIRSMANYLDNNPNLEQAFVNADCEGNRRLLEMTGKPVTTYGQSEHAELRATLLGENQFPMRFEVSRHGDRLGEVEMSIPGLYNVTNACGAIAVTTHIGVPFEQAAKALSTFSGLENRFSIVRAGGITIVKDYISHPTGMKRVLESARGLTDGRIFTVWKPYRYTLLNYLQDEYATAFAGSHEVLITTMYAAKEDPIPGIDTAFICDKIRGTGMNVTYVPDDHDVIGALEERVRPGDKVIFFGGDDYFRMADGWADRLGRG